MPTSRLPRLTSTFFCGKTEKTTPRGACTILPSHLSLLWQPTLDGRQHERCNSWRLSSGKNHRSSHVKDKSASQHDHNNKAHRKGPAEASTQLLLHPAVDEPASSQTSTLRKASARASAGCSRCSQLLTNRFPIYDFLLAGLVFVRVPSLLGVSYLPQRLGPAASVREAKSSQRRVYFTLLSDINLLIFFQHDRRSATFLLPPQHALPLPKLFAR